MVTTITKNQIDFFVYPPIGTEDWRYAYPAARARVLDSMLLTKGTLVDLANAESFDAAIEMLSATEYALSQGSRTVEQVNEMLSAKRSQARDIFEKLMLDEQIAELFKTRDDFANLKLALKRYISEKAIGTDYSSDGNVPAEDFEKAFEEESSNPFPEFLQKCADEAFLDYYDDKDVRRIDYAIDRYQMRYVLVKAHQLNNLFLVGLFRMQIDLTNIRTMLRLKFTDMHNVSVFLEGGFVEMDIFRQGLDAGYESIPAMFAATPYHRIVESATHYLTNQESFLRLDQLCEEHITGYNQSTLNIAAGPQPVIAYLLNKEQEIRTVRLILTAKKNKLDTKLILDRLGQ